MADSPLSRKFGIKPAHKLLVVNAPEGYQEKLRPLPDGAEIHSTAEGSPFDFVLVFMQSKADVDIHSLHAIEALKPGGLIWFAYPKKSSGIKTDISRDEGWETVHKAGYQGIALISIDDTWSAMRFRPTADIKS
jgi:hypothetical protein